MRGFIAALLLLAAGSSAYAAGNQQQCEALSKPIEAKFAPFQTEGEDFKVTPQRCALAKDLIKSYEEYTAKANKLNCAFAYVPGKAIGGAAERADLLADMKKAYTEKCR